MLVCTKLQWSEKWYHMNRKVNMAGDDGKYSNVKEKEYKEKKTET